MTGSRPPKVGLRADTSDVVLFWLDEPLVLAPIVMSEEDALRFAAQLVAVVDPGHERFPTFMLEALQSPGGGLEGALASDAFARRWLEAGKGDKSGDGQV